MELFGEGASNPILNNSTLVHNVIYYNPVNDHYQSKFYLRPKECSLGHRLLFK